MYSVNLTVFSCI